jgi:hypothetical protein
MLELALQRGFALDFATGWHSFFSPDNPFVPWMLIVDLVLFLLYLVSIYWVYRDAMWRYNRGAPWAAAAALLPLAGWLFYLFYRISPLVELDYLEAEMFDEADLTWTDFDQYQKNRGSELFQEIAAVWARPEGGGYSPLVRLSRQRELLRQLTPAERAARAADRRQQQEETRQKKAQADALRKQRAAELAQQRRERRTMVGAHGFKYNLSERRQQALQNRLKLVEELKRLPREDERIEELIYQMDYAAALQAARDGLQVAEEMRDEQGQATYRRYVERLETLTGRGEPPGTISQ